MAPLKWSAAGPKTGGQGGWRERGTSCRTAVRPTPGLRLFDGWGQAPAAISAWPAARPSENRMTSFTIFQPTRHIPRTHRDCCAHRRSGVSGSPPTDQLAC